MRSLKSECQVGISFSQEGLRGNPQNSPGTIQNGTILLSREELQDPNFTSTVVLVCVHDENGSFGFVLNRPAHMPLREVFDVDAALQPTRRKLYIGGPVRQEELHILQQTEQTPPKSFQIVPGVCFGGEWESLEQILAASEQTTRLILGYSGWGPGQLEEELKVGAWETYQVDLPNLLQAPDSDFQGSLETIRARLLDFSVSEG